MIVSVQTESEGESLKTVPQPPHVPRIPPADVVPYRLPWESIVSAPLGTAPSGLPTKVCKTVSSHRFNDLGRSWKTTPAPSVPPPSVVPNTVPVGSTTTPEIGSPPSMPPVKLCNTCSFHGPFGVRVSRKTVPWLCGPP